MSECTGPQTVNYPGQRRTGTDIYDRCAGSNHVCVSEVASGCPQALQAVPCPAPSYALIKVKTTTLAR